MKQQQQTYMLVALALAGVYMLMKPKAATAATKPAASSSGTPAATEIMVQGNANGWRYFSDGTAIDPWGTYYKNGVQVYNPMM